MYNNSRDLQECFREKGDASKSFEVFVGKRRHIEVHKLRNTFQKLTLLQNS